MVSVQKKKDGCYPSLSPTSDSVFGDGTVSCDSTSSVVNLSDFDDKVNEKYRLKKHQSSYLADVYIELDELSRAMRVNACGNFLDFSSSTGKLLHANFCRDRLCPMCNYRRSLKIYSHVSKMFDFLGDKYSYLFLTLTIKNCPVDELKANIDQLFNGWKYLINKNKRFMKSILGTIRVLEVTYNSVSDEWHPHLHCILAVSKSYFNSRDYISHGEFVDLWKTALKVDYDPVVDIRRFSSRSHSGFSDDISSDVSGITDSDLRISINEISKYIAKGSDYLDFGDFESTVRKVVSLLGGISRRRLFSTSGVFRKAFKELQLSDIENGELVDDTIRSDVADSVIHYEWKGGFYVR